MNPLPPHLLVVPVVLPLLAAALMLVLGERRRRFASIINIGATGAGLLVALAILGRVDADGVPGAIGVYLAANWEAPFGIVLVADRLSALMLVLTGVVGLATAVYAVAGWSRAGVYFHPLFQIQLMGLNGAFLTGDLFNLFVFFEVMLAASYGLLLHGSGWARVHSGLHYIAVNLLASSLFLVGLAMLYGVMGTLSMADIAAKLPLVAAEDRGLLHAGAAILAVAFLTKAAIWPLNFWLVPAYAAASAPVAALFALMTKVGIYAILRLWTCSFPGGRRTIGAFRGVGPPLRRARDRRLRRPRSHGVSAPRAHRRLLDHRVVGNAPRGDRRRRRLRDVDGALLSAELDVGREPAVPARRARRTSGHRRPRAAAQAGRRAGRGHQSRRRGGGARGSRHPGVAGAARPGLHRLRTARRGLAAAVGLRRQGHADGGALERRAGLGLSPATPAAIWSLFGLLLLSGLVATVSMTRAGIRHFWSPADRPAPRLNVAEGLPVLALLLACAWLTVRAEPVLRYTSATAEALHAPAAYIEAVLSTKPVPGPTRPL